MKTFLMHKEKQKERYERFYTLHHAEKLLVLPNIWDPLGAILLESLGYPAVATASASVAFANGYDDGENIPFNDFTALLRRITDCVDIPVSADIESGYAADEIRLKKNIRELIETGIVGINIEDSDKRTNSLLSTEAQCQRLSLIKEVSRELEVPLFINARTDVYVRGKNFVTPESKIEETLRRGAAYKAAGADCFFPIALKETEDIKEIVKQLQMPVNISLMPGGNDLNTLQEIGVARVSLGPSMLKIAIKATQNLALGLQKYEGLKEITENEITTPYLKDLVNKKYKKDAAKNEKSG
jgi:2-methylisocitrate lyase-like PEP mutase family enzyme